MDGGYLTKELISDPIAWHLSLKISKESLGVMLYPMEGGIGLIYRSIELDKTKSQTAALEEAVYDNPLLLDDFGKIDIAISTKRHLIVPTDINHYELRTEMMSLLWGSDEYVTVESQLGTSGESLLIGVDRPMISFIQRTFPSAKIMHRLHPLIVNFYNKESENSSPKIYLNICDEYLDVVAICGGKILVANTFETQATEDALYYALTVAQSSGFDMLTDEVIVCGDPSKRAELRTQLRTYVNNVNPYEMPEALKRAYKYAENAPLELMLLEICE